MAEELLKELMLRQELKDRDAKDASELSLLFTKTCVNALPARNKNNKPMLYRRDDLTNWAKDACAHGEDYFYVSPKNPKEPNGVLMRDHPRYQYKLSRPLSENEYDLLSKLLAK